MGVAPDIHQLFGVNFGITLGGGEAGMAKEFLDRTQVGAIAEQMRGKGMAQRMRGGVLGQAIEAAEVAQSFLHNAGVQAARIAGSKGTMRCLLPLPVTSRALSAAGMSRMFKDSASLMRRPAP
jgi:hypothetical protein